MAILTIAFALGATVMQAMADAGASEGDFTMDNTAPVVGTIDLRLGSTGEPAGSSMTPQTAYNVSMAITDLNQLDDIVTIDVVIQDTSYSWAGATNVSTKVTYTWTAGGDWAEVSSPSETPGGNTWGVLDTAKCIVPSELTQTAGTWWLYFTPGKVAKETTWNITVTATDASDNHHNVLGDLSMQWFGEIEPKTGSTAFSFGSLGLGTNNDSMDGSYLNINTTTNGNYGLTSGTGNWISGDYTVTLDPNGGALTAGTFALRNLGANTVGSANYVPASGGTITDLDGETSNYLEVGNTVPVYLWLSTASEGIMPGEYGGTYTMTIVNAA